MDVEEAEEVARSRQKFPTFPDAPLALVMATLLLQRVKQLMS